MNYHSSLPIIEFISSLIAFIKAFEFILIVSSTQTVILRVLLYVNMIIDDNPNPLLIIGKISFTSHPQYEILFTGPGRFVIANPQFDQHL